MSEGEKTVWLLGAGFSRPLDGPLFTDLISIRQLHWVNAWLGTRGGVSFNAPDYTFDDCVRIFLQGCGRELWENAEECIALLDRAQSDTVAGRMAKAVINAATTEQRGLKSEIALKDNQVPLRLDEVFARFTQFLAIATSHYVPDDSAELPEAWKPYENWMATLGPDDTVISFNYDRVVETLKEKQNSECGVFKLHGTTLDHETLTDHIRVGKAVRSICVPGPSKLAASRGDLAPAWKEAATALQAAKRLVVIGYSFPASDAMSLDFVLRYSKARCVDIVVGPDTPSNHDGTRVRELFRHLGNRAVDTKQYAQTFLTEGTARTQDGKFIHGSKLPLRVDDLPPAPEPKADLYDNPIDPYEGMTKPR